MITIYKIIQKINMIRIDKIILKCILIKIIINDKIEMNVNNNNTITILTTIINTQKKRNKVNNNNKQKTNNKNKISNNNKGIIICKIKIMTKIKSKNNNVIYVDIII